MNPRRRVSSLCQTPYSFSLIVVKLLLGITLVVLADSLYANDRVVDSLLQDIRSSKSDRQRAGSYLAISQRVVTKDYGQALRYAQDAVAAAELDGDHALLVSIYKNLASIFYFIGIYDQSIRFFEKTAQEAAKAGDEAEVMNGRMNQALLHVAIGNYREVLSVLEGGEEELRRTYRKMGKEVPVADLISLELNLGVCLVGLEDLPNAYVHLDKGISLARSDPSQKMSLSKLLQVKAKAKLKEGKIEEALVLLKEAEGIHESIDDLPVLLLVKETMAAVHEQKGDDALALSELKSGYQGAQTIGSLLMKKSFSEQIYKIYRRQEQSDSALRYMDLFNAHDAETKTGKLKDELMRKELLKSFSERESALMQAQSSARSRYGLLIGGILLLSASLGWGLLIFRRKFRTSDLQKMQLQLRAERMELEQQQLQSQMADKDKQLTDMEFRLSKNAMLDSLVTELQTMQVRRGNVQSAHPVASENAKLIQQGKIWEEFELRFVTTHAGFYDRLQAYCPTLTLNERRLCAFLKLDMTTKEISIITGQTVRAIEIARTRLRKKLSLGQTDTRLFEFLSSL